MTAISRIVIKTAFTYCLRFAYPAPIQSRDNLTNASPFTTAVPKSLKKLPIAFKKLPTADAAEFFSCAAIPFPPFFSFLKIAHMHFHAYGPFVCSYRFISIFTYSDRLTQYALLYRSSYTFYQVIQCFLNCCIIICCQSSLCNQLTKCLCRIPVFSAYLLCLRIFRLLCQR